MAGCWLAIASLAASSNLLAAPEPYTRIYLESSIAASPTAQTEIESLERGAVSLDLAGQSVEFGASVGLAAIRAFDFLDASSDGSSFLSQSTDKADGCDGAPPCTESVAISNGYLTLPGGSLLNRPKGLLSPGAELFVSVQGEEGRVQGQPSYTGIEAQIAKPASLTEALLDGSYQLVTYAAGIDRDVVGNSSEDTSVNRVDLSFNGEGTCAGAVVGSAALRQETEWPDVDSRQNVFATLEAEQDFLACSYTVDADTGSAAVALELSDGGDTFALDLTLFVSAQGRYLAGRLSSDRDEGTTVGVAQSLIIGALTSATQQTNAELAGVYFLSSIGETLTGTATAGIDADFVTRAALEFSGATPAPDGFSACSILGFSLVGPARSLGGSIPGPTPATIEFVSVNTQASGSCRYRSVDSQTVALELDTPLGLVQTDFAISDDAQTLLGIRLLTTEDPLPAGVDVSLEVPGVALAELLVLQRYAGAATDAQVQDFAEPVVPAIDPEIVVVASVLPGGRAVQVGETATAFATLINAGASVGGLGCDIRYRGSRSLDFFYQETNPLNNAPLGEPNTPIDVQPGAAQTFFFGITPFEEFAPEDIELDFSCLNGASAASLVGLNTLLLSASTSPVADIIALGATVTNNGIAVLDGANGTGFFSLASFNVGAGEDMLVSVDTGSATLPLVATICQTTPATGVCENPTVPSSAPVSVNIPNSGVPTFAVFLTASASIALDPANKRVFVRFSDSGGAIRGATSVAVQAP